MASLVILGGVAFAASHYHQTGRWPFGPERDVSVSEQTFDSILAQLRARPNIAPEFSPPTDISDESDAARACGLASQAVTFTQPIPDQSAAASAGQPRYTLKATQGRILSSEGSSGVVMATAKTFAVNVDGHPRAYHPADIYGRCDTTTTGPAKGQTVCAINVLCYGGIRIFNGAREIPCGRHEDFKSAWNDVWAEIEGRRAKQIPRAYWQRSGNRMFDHSYGFFHATKPVTVMFRDTIIRQDNIGQPCRRDVPGTKYEGYFVSATSLTGNEGPDETEGTDANRIVTDKRCDPVPYVDAEKLPSIVIPLGGFAGAKVGDLVIGYRKDANGGERWVYAIVGDEGPNHKFGEGSIAFNAAIMGSSGPWPSYREITRDLHVATERLGGGPVGVVIFKATHARLGGLVTATNVEKHATEVFTAWGGGEIERAKDRFRACMTALE